MGTSPKLTHFKVAAVCGALLVAGTPAFSAGAGGAAPSGSMGTGTGSTPGLGPRALGAGQLGPSQGTPLGTVTPYYGTMGAPRMSTSGAPNQSMGAGLSPSEQSLLMNFGNPTTSAQTKANAEIRNEVVPLYGSPTSAVKGYSAINTGSNSGGASNSGVTGSATTSGPVVNPPDPRNPGTLAETAQPPAP